MSGYPYISVLVPAYNAEETLAETLESLEAQDYDLFEVVVIDDGSTDGTAAIAREFMRRSDVFRLVSKENGGTASAYNRGFKEMRGTYASICAADDVLMPNCLSTHARAIEEHPDFQVFSSNGFSFQVEEGWERPIFTGPEWSTSREFTLKDLSRYCVFGVGSVFLRSAALEMGGFKPVLVDDYDFWLRLMANGYRFWYTAEYLAAFRISPTQRSAQVAELEEAHLAALWRASEEPLLDEQQRAILVSAAQRYQQNMEHREQRIEMEQQRKRLYERVNRLPQPLRSCVVVAINLGKPLVLPLRKALSLRATQKVEKKNG